MRVVLASNSPRRRELLAAVLDRFEVRAAGVDEHLSGDPRADAARLALAKAEAVLRVDPAMLALGADTIVADEHRSYGKPANKADAREMLRSLRGRPHVVYTGVAVATGGWAPLVAVSESIVEMSPLEDAQVDLYVASGRPLDKAGAYAIQDEDVPTVGRLHGCYCSVMGLPLWLTRDLLADLGVLAQEPHFALQRCAACPERTGAID
jgi:septum formation protein